MSNIIKAYSIKYNENDKKSIDLNEKADMFQKLYFDNISGSKASGDKSNDFLEKSSSGVGEFVEGIKTIQVEATDTDIMEAKEETLKNFENDYLEEKLKQEEAAKKLLEAAKDDASNLLAKAQAEAMELKNEIFEKAKSEGYNAGKETALIEVQRQLQKMSEEQEKIKKEYEKQISNLEPAFVELLISFVKKLTNYAIEDKKDIILYLVEQALHGSDSSNSYIIKVSKEDYELVHAKKMELLWQLKDGTELEVLEDRLLTRGQCLIETDSRVIDCSLDVQLKNLIGDLRLLAGCPQDTLLGESND